MNKERIKGIAIGFILCLTLSTSVMVVANTQTVTREITYGVRVNLNGQLLHFDYDMRPFVMENRTFLPVRAISEALELPVDFDPSTNTVYLGNRFLGQRTPFIQAAPHFDTGGNNSDALFFTSVATVDSVTMSGATYNDALKFSSTTNLAANTRFTLHNLGGQFRILSGYAGRVDGSQMIGATINFIGDGRLLQSYTLQATDMPTPISVFVEGVNQLRIEVTFGETRNIATVNYALVAFLE